jgi:PAS domain-containing protein
LLSDKSIIERLWRGSVKPGQALPQYEDVVLGSLGRLGDHLLLFEGGTQADFKVLRAGRKVRDWAGADPRDKRLADLPRDCALALAEVLTQSIEVGAPVRHRMLRVTDGMVETYEMLGFPLACRWGAPLAGVYVGEAGTRYNLVDTIFRSTDEGIVALAAIRNARGDVIDFQIVAFNEGAAELLGADAKQLHLCRVSELPLGPAALAIRDRLIACIGTGRFEQFEFAFTRKDDKPPQGETHLHAGIASVGDLLSITLTDIAEIKQREASFRLLFDGNPVPMWLYDPSDFKILSFNDAALAHYGYSRERLQTMTLYDL